VWTPRTSFYVYFVQGARYVYERTCGELGRRGWYATYRTHTIRGAFY
jgi:hypothetical protein